MTHVQININTIQAEIPVPSTIQLYQLREDREVFGGVRSCAPCPAVFTFKDDPHVVMSQQWQYYLIAINYNMVLDDIYLILDTHLAFANGTGFRSDLDLRADFFHNKDLKYPPPNLDKVRSCSRNVVTGVEEYSLRFALQNLLQGFLRASRRSVVSVLASKNLLNVKTFDSTKLPPLKEGRIYPQSVAEIDPTAYLYMPQYNREMFCVADIVNKSGEVVQFPRGGLYSWTHDNTPYTFLPHISNPSYGSILYPLEYLNKLPIGSPVPSVYKRI